MSTEKDNPEPERDLLLERFQQACSFITTVVQEKDPLFAEFTERFLWLFYYSGYRHVTWMIGARPDLDRLHSLFRYHWDKDINEPPSGEVLMRAMQLTFHDRLDLPRETLTGHIEECFRDALEELRVSNQGEGRMRPIEVGPSEEESTPDLDKKSEGGEKFTPTKYGGKELCIAVSYHKDRFRDLRRVALGMRNKANIRYSRHGYPDPLAWYQGNPKGFTQHLWKLRNTAKRKNWYDSIPSNYYRTYVR